MSYCSPSPCVQKPWTVNQKITYIQKVFQKTFSSGLSTFLTKYPLDFRNFQELKTLTFFLLLPLEDFRSPNPDPSKHLGWEPHDFLTATCEKHGLNLQTIMRYKKDEDFRKFRDQMANPVKSCEAYNAQLSAGDVPLDQNIPVDLVLCIWKLEILKAVFASSSEQSFSGTVLKIETWILGYCREKYAGYSPVFQRPDQLAVMNCWSLSSLAPGMLVVQGIGSGCSAPAFFAGSALTWVAGSILCMVFAFLPISYYLYRSRTCHACLCQQCCDCSIWGPCHRGKLKPAQGFNIQGDPNIYDSIVTDQPKAQPQLPHNFLDLTDQQLKDLLFRIGETYSQTPDLTRSPVMEKIYCIVLGPSCCCLELVCPGADCY